MSNGSPIVIHHYPPCHPNAFHPLTSYRNPAAVCKSKAWTPVKIGSRWNDTEWGVTIFIEKTKWKRITLWQCYLWFNIHRIVTAHCIEVSNIFYSQYFNRMWLHVHCTCSNWLTQHIQLQLQLQFFSSFMTTQKHFCNCLHWCRGARWVSSSTFFQHKRYCVTALSHGFLQSVAPGRGPVPWLNLFASPTSATEGDNQTGSSWKQWR